MQPHTGSSLGSMYCMQSTDQAPVYFNIPNSNNKVSKIVIAEMLMNKVTLLKPIQMETQAVTKSDRLETTYLGGKNKDVGQNYDPNCPL